MTPGQPKGLTAVNLRVVGIVCGSVLATLMVAAFVTTASGRTTEPQAGRNPAIGSTADRDAAVWVVRHYGVVTVKTDHGKTAKFVAEEHLPAEPFVVTEINLYGQEFDEGELSFLAQLSSLEKLDLSNTGVTTVAMQYAGAVSSLKALYLRGNNVSADLLRLLKNAQQYERCSVSGCDGFDDDAITVMAAIMPNLRVLGCTSTDISDAALAPLLTMKSLTSLMTANNDLSAESIDELTKALPKCKIKT
ncbi:MAG: hypothetical protein KDA89_04300 [Planctomycetaceae bacterium]|nr:hypothetical protein [Planctomycetaceae bacterium]